MLVKARELPEPMGAGKLVLEAGPLREAVMPLMASTGPESKDQ